MKTIQLQIDDNNYDSFLTIIKNLKDGFIKNFTVSNTKNTIEAVSFEEQNYYENLLKNMSEDDRTISSKESIKIWI